MKRIHLKFFDMWQPYMGKFYMSGMTSTRLAVWVDGEFLESGNAATAIGYTGVRGLAPAPDWRSDWYGYGLRPYSENILPWTGSSQVAKRRLRREIHRRCRAARRELATSGINLTWEIGEL